MEVHHHSHTPGKKWTHYFWEFLMLFLAVFCGFLAEYRLEHMIEHNRAKVYAVNLYQELKKDTVRLNYLIGENNRVAKKLDTLCLYSTEKKERNITNGMLYYYAHFTVNLDYFSPNNATVEELKGSGNLRLMKSNVAHEISDYDKKIRELQSEYQISRAEFEKYEALYFKIFDGYIMELLAAGKNEIENRDSVFKLNIPFVNDDPKLMKEYIGWMKFEQTIYEMQSERYLAPLKQYATELLVLLKKEYHMK